MKEPSLWVTSQDLVTSLNLSGLPPRKRQQPLYACLTPVLALWNNGTSWFRGQPNIQLLSDPSLPFGVDCFCKEPGACTKDHAATSILQELLCHISNPFADVCWTPKILNMGPTPSLDLPQHGTLRPTAVGGISLGSESKASHAEVVAWAASAGGRPTSARPPLRGLWQRAEGGRIWPWVQNPNRTPSEHPQFQHG